MPINKMRKKLIKAPEIERKGLCAFKGLRDDILFFLKYITK